jgi:hypothetical protein
MDLIRKGMVELLAVAWAGWEVLRGVVAPATPQEDRSRWVLRQAWYESRRDRFPVRRRVYSLHRSRKQYYTFVRLLQKELLGEKEPIPEAHYSRSDDGPEWYKASPLELQVLRRRKSNGIFCAEGVPLAHIALSQVVDQRSTLQAAPHAQNVVHADFTASRQRQHGRHPPSLSR